MNDNLSKAKKGDLHITELDESTKVQYVSWLVDKSITELRATQYLKDDEVARLMDGRRLPEPKKYVVLLSSAPGVDGNGAPGLSSAVSLKLLYNALDAIDKDKIMAVTCYLDEYNDSEWVKAAQEFARGQEGIETSVVDITAICKIIDLTVKQTMSASEQSNFSVSTYATLVRSLMPQLYCLGSVTVAGYSSWPSRLYNLFRCSDDGGIAPVGEWDRTTIMEVGKYLGIEDNVLYQMPHNGAKGGDSASRLMTKFGLDVPYSPQLAGIIDLALFLKQKGEEDGEIVARIRKNEYLSGVVGNLPNYDVQLENIVEKVSKKYDRFYGQLKVQSTLPYEN